MSSPPPSAHPVAPLPFPVPEVGSRGRYARAVRRGILTIVAVAAVLPATLLPATLLAVTVLAPALAQAEPEPARGRALPGSRKQFNQVVTSWQRGDAAGVVGMVAPRGLLTLHLLSPAVRGRHQAANAQRTLRTYFKQVSGMRLVDVTKSLRPQPYGINVREYDYTYAPRGRDKVTTRLVISMKLYGGSEWKLDSIVEKPRPPPGPR